MSDWNPTWYRQQVRYVPEDSYTVSGGLMAPLCPDLLSNPRHR